MRMSYHNVALIVVFMLATAWADFTPPQLTTWNDLDAAVLENNDNFTNWACIYPPGLYQFGVTAGYYTFVPDSVLATATNLFAFSPRLGVPVWTVRITETQGEDRVWLYAGTEGSIFRTNSVQSGFDPQLWVRDAYGGPPLWLSSTNLDEWYAERDRSRMRLELILVASNDWPLLLEAWANAATNTTMPESPPPTLPPDTNRFAFAGIENMSSNSLRLWIYSPTNPAPIDVFSCVALPPPGGLWSLVGMTGAGSPFSVLDTSKTADTAFYHIARGDVDSDDDGLSDGRELMAFGTDPFLADSDGDGLSDREELYRCGTDPNAVDSDGDGVWDGEDQSPLTPGPVITILSPSDEATLGSPDVTVYGEITFAGTLADVRVDSQPSDIYDRGNGTYAFTNTLSMAEGPHDVVVRAVSADTLPLESKKSVRVTIDTLPSDITILAPVDFASFGGANVRVTVWTESTNDVVTVDGGTTTRDGYMRYAWVTLSALGTNTIRAVAVDTQNRASTNTVTVLCTDLADTAPNDADNDGVPDPDDPEPNNPSVTSTVTITSPLNGTPVRGK